MSLGGVEVKFEIDDTKVTVLSRATRLRGLAVDYLGCLRAAIENDELTPLGDSHSIALLDEVLAWLNELET